MARGRKTSKEMTMQKAVQQIQRLEASKKDLENRNSALQRKRVAMVQNNEAKLAAINVLNAVEDWHNKRAKSDVASAEEDQQRFENELADLRDQLANAVREAHAADAEVLSDDLRRMPQDLRSKVANLLQVAETGPKDSQTRLQLVMNTPGASAKELRGAIRGVEAMLEEARRELERLEFRDRRAAFEELHLAMEQAEEVRLERAIEAAKAANVEQEDVEKAEQKLLELQALSPEERAARNLRIQEIDWKRDAFVMVKQKDMQGLRTLVSDLDEKVKFEEWRDHNGRSLIEFAKFIGVCGVDDVVRQPKRMPEESSASEIPEDKADEKLDVTAGAEDAEDSSAASSMDNALSNSGTESQETRDPAPEEPSQTEEAPVSAEEEESLKKTAFASIVQAKYSELEEVLKKVNQSTWLRWENKGGKDLHTLAQERGRQIATSILLKAQGIVKQREHPALEERQAVWIWQSGDVQARRASVLEDTAANAEHVLIQFWDGSEDEQYVPRCIVST